MYNRYIPQSDGSYQKHRMPDQSRPRPTPQRQQPQFHKEEPPQESRKEEQEFQPPLQEPPQKKPQYAPPPGGSVTGFLRQLLPKDFDTADLLIVLLILLMAGDCEEDRNTALLTLALYFFM